MYAYLLLLPDIIIIVVIFFFSQFDPEGFGEIPWDDFARALNSVEFQRQIGNEHKLRQLREKLNDQLALRSKGVQVGITSAITFQDFVNVVSPFF